MTSEISPDRLGAPSTDEVRVKLEMLADATAVRNTEEIDLTHDEDEVPEDSLGLSTEPFEEHVVNDKLLERGHTPVLIPAISSATSTPSAIAIGSDVHQSSLPPSLSGLRNDEGFNDLFPEDWNPFDDDNGFNETDQFGDQTAKDSATPDTSQIAPPLPWPRSTHQKVRGKYLDPHRARCYPTRLRFNGRLSRHRRERKLKSCLKSAKVSMAPLSTSVPRAATDATT